MYLFKKTFEEEIKEIIIVIRKKEKYLKKKDEIKTITCLSLVQARALLVLGPPSLHADIVK